MYNFRKEAIENLNLVSNNSYQAVTYLTHKVQANRVYYKPQLFLSLYSVFTSRRQSKTIPSD